MNPQQPQQTQRANAIIITKATNGFVIHNNLVQSPTVSIATNLNGVIDLIQSFLAPTDTSK